MTDRDPAPRPPRTALHIAGLLLIILLLGLAVGSLPY